MFSYLSFLVSFVLIMGFMRRSPYTRSLSKHAAYTKAAIQSSAHDLIYSSRYKLDPPTLVFSLANFFCLAASPSANS